MGFLYAASGPLVRSSYKAAEVFVRSISAARGRSGGTCSKRASLPGGADRHAAGEGLAAARGEVAPEPTASELAREAVTLLATAGPRRAPLW